MLYNYSLIYKINPYQDLISPFISLTLILIQIGVLFYPKFLNLDLSSDNAGIKDLFY